MNNEITTFPYYYTPYIIYPIHNTRMLITIDLPITKICHPEIEINPLQSSPQQGNPESPQFCLSLLILLIPYAYLLYLYATSLLFIHHKNLFHELDGLDAVVIGISMLRLLTVFVLTMVQHYGGLVFLAILAYLWQAIVAAIFVKFVVDQPKIYRIICGAFFFCHLLYCILVNLSDQSDDPFDRKGLIIPLLLPWIVLVLVVTGISLWELYLIQKSLDNNILTPIISVQVKNRRSFAFLILACSWFSLIMRKFPDIFKPLEGVVLYFLISEWINMVVIYRTVLDRIVRSHEEEDSELGEGLAARNSGVIVVEMHHYGNSK